ncbi:MAG: hypothetical protein ABI051_01370 [Vicinamibacterales bacterium]
MNEEIDDPLADLVTALSIEPSPEFAVNVRSRIERAANTRIRWWVVRTTALAAVAVAAVVLRWTMPVSAPERPGQMASIASTTPVLPDALSPAVLWAPPAVSPPVAGQSADHVRQPQPVRPRAPQPEVLVPPGQALALQRLALALQDGRVTIPADAWPTIDTPAGDADAPLKPIEIVPVRLDPIVIDPQAPEATPDQER